MPFRKMACPVLPRLPISLDSVFRHYGVSCSIKIAVAPAKRFAWCQNFHRPNEDLGLNAIFLVSRRYC
jgi:hypothetical protein